jgi:hypothetical protein
MAKVIKIGFKEESLWMENEDGECDLKVISKR